MKKAVVLWVGASPFANRTTPPSLNEVLAELGANKNGILEVHVEAAVICSNGCGRPATGPVVDLKEFGRRALAPQFQFCRPCFDELMEVDIRPT